MKNTTVQNKSQLAKLLATENIEVQENAVQTASFDVKDRILTIPIFKEEQRSKHVYDMLVGHEVSHALHTPSDGWMNMKDRSKEFRSFVNVIEDARIDKLIQKKYPGLTKDYLLGFKKMYKDNFFGTKDKNLQKDYTLIDKINMYYKSSKTLDFNFNNKEKHFVKLVDDCKTFADVQKLAEDILGYCKEELKKTPQLKKTYTPKKVEGDDNQKGDNQDSDSDNSSDSNDNKSTEDKLNDFLDQQVPDEKVTKETDKKDSEESEKGAAANGADGDVQIISITNQNYDEAIQKQVDGDASSRSYVKLPKVNLKNMIIPYKEYIRDFAKDNAKLYGEDKEGLKYAHDEADKFLKESSSVVNYLVKEFEMKKNAKLHARSTISKTGIIDPLKLHSYKYAEDIFKKMSNIPNQKNHGMIFLLDWSGSMQRHIKPTVEQLLNLVLFCRKINIPFSVYKFVNNGEGLFNNRYESKNKNHPTAPFVLDSNTPNCDQTTRLVQLFSHKQSKSDFKRSAQNIYRSALTFGDYYSYRRRYDDPDYHRVPSIPGKYYMSSTPLNESLIAMDNIIAKFKSDYKTEKVALVTLTDGSANSVSSNDGGQMMIKLGNKYHKCEWSYRDEKKDLTYHLLKYLKRKYDLQTIGFFLVNKYRELAYTFHVPYAKEALAKRMFTKDKFIPDYKTGYDVYFYVKSDTNVQNKVFDGDTNTTNKKTLKKMFTSGMKKRLNSRVLLQNFIKRIA